MGARGAKSSYACHPEVIRGAQPSTGDPKSPERRALDPAKQHGTSTVPAWVFDADRLRMAHCRRRVS